MKFDPAGKEWLLLLLLRSVALTDLEFCAESSSSSFMTKLPCCLEGEGETGEGGGGDGGGDDGGDCGGGGGDGQVDNDEISNDTQSQWKEKKKSA